MTTAKFWLKNVFFGLAMGIGFIMLNLISSFSIALPVISLSLADNVQFLVVGVLAPVIEEVLFALFFLLTYYVSKKNFVIAAILTSVVFGLYHLVAYQAQLGSLVASMIFRLAAVSIFFFRKVPLRSPTTTAFAGTVVSLIVMHATFNIFLLGKTGLVVVAL